MSSTRKSKQKKTYPQFANKLNMAMRDQEASSKKLKVMMKTHATKFGTYNDFEDSDESDLHNWVTRVNNWTTGRALPGTINFLILADALGLTPKQLLGLDEAPLSEPRSFRKRDRHELFVNDRTRYTIEKNYLVMEAKETLWIQVRSTYSMDDVLKSLIQALKRNVAVQLLVCDPTDYVTMEMLSRRRYIGQGTAQATSDRITSGCKIIYDEIGTREEEMRLLEVRAIKHIPSTIIYLSDPETADVKLLTGAPVFQNFPEQGAFVLADSHEYPEMVNLHEDQFRLLWNEQELTRPLNLETLETEVHAAWKSWPKSAN